MCRRPARWQSASSHARERQGTPVYAKGAEPLCLSLGANPIQSCGEKKKHKFPPEPYAVFNESGVSMIAAGRVSKNGDHLVYALAILYVKPGWKTEFAPSFPASIVCESNSRISPRSRSMPATLSDSKGGGESAQQGTEGESHKRKSASFLGFLPTSHVRSDLPL